MWLGSLKTIFYQTILQQSQANVSSLIYSEKSWQREFFHMAHLFSVLRVRSSVLFVLQLVSSTFCPRVPGCSGDERYIVDTEDNAVSCHWGLLAMTNLYNILRDMLVQEKLVAKSSWIPTGPKNNLANFSAS